MMKFRLGKKAKKSAKLVGPKASKSAVLNSNRAPEPVGLYPHARRVGNLLFLSGVGREGGFEAMRFFTEAKNVCIKL